MKKTKKGSFLWNTVYLPICWWKRPQQSLQHPYLTLPLAWTGCYTCPALRPNQFGPVHNIIKHTHELTSTNLHRLSSLKQQTPYVETLQVLLWLNIIMTTGKVSDLQSMGWRFKFQSVRCHLITMGNSQSDRCNQQLWEINCTWLCPWCYENNCVTFLVKSSKRTTIFGEIQYLLYRWWRRVALQNSVTFSHPSRPKLHPKISIRPLWLRIGP